VVQIIFDFWNLYKGQGKWWSHRKITPEIIKAVLENFPRYSVEDICAAIDNYAKVLIGEQYFWSHSWPLYTFLTVKHGKYKAAEKKWWQFLPENFIEENYLIVKKRNGDDSDEKIVDTDPELTKELIQKYALLIGNKEFKPTSKQYNYFVKTVQKMKGFYEKRSIIKDTWVKYLIECVEENYINRGWVVDPWDLCSERVWNILMPQFLRELGCFDD